MVFQEREELYLALSRKELQELCRNHGLPYTNRTKGRLAKSVVDYFNRRASSEGTFKARGRRGRQPLRGLVGRKKMKEIARESGASQMRGHMVSNVHEEIRNLAKDASAADKTVYSHLSHYVKENFDCRKSGENFQNYFTIETAFKNLPLVQRGNVFSNEISSGSGLASSSEIFADAPASFQFFVRAEEGINLYVDLNSSPSNWVKRLNDEVSINQKAHKDKSWSICNELRDTGIKNVEMSSEDNTDTFKNIGEPPTQGLDESKESCKSCLTCIVPDKSAESIEFIHESNRPSSSCAISSGVEYCNDSSDLQCSVFVQASDQNPGKDSVLNDNSLLSGNSLDQNICNHMHKENVQNLLVNPLTNGDSLNCRNAESDSLVKSPISTSETSDIAPKICFDGVIQMNPENGSCSELLLEAEVLDDIVPSNQQHSGQFISESHTNMVHSDGGDSADYLPEGNICGSLASSASENVTIVASEEQCNNPYMEEKVISGDDRSSNLVGKASKRSSKSVISERKRLRSFAEGSKGSMINLRSRKTLARGPIYGLAAFPRRSMRLVSK